MKITPWISLQIKLREKENIDIKELVNLARNIKVGMDSISYNPEEQYSTIQETKKNLKVLWSLFIGIVTKHMKEEVKESFNTNFGVIMRVLDQQEEGTIGTKWNSIPHIRAFANEIEPYAESIRIVLENAEKISKNESEFYENAYKGCYANIGVFGAIVRIKKTGDRFDLTKGMTPAVPNPLVDGVDKIIQQEKEMKNTDDFGDLEDDEDF